jgi:hypothetical protein
MSLVILQLLFLSDELYAQNDNYDEEYDEQTYSAWMFEGAFSIFDPINTFGQNVEGSKAGFNLSLFKQAKPGSDVFIGLTGYYTQIGSDLQENFTSTNEPVDDLVSSNVLGFDIVFRYYPDLVFSILEPFAEATFGTRFYYSISKSYYPDFDETLDYMTNELNSSLAYGFGFGTHVILSDSWAINLKMNYQLANIAKYYVENGENNVDPLTNFDLKNSSTDWIRYDIGASFIF